MSDKTHDTDDPQTHPGRDGLPDSNEQNHEENEPTQPTRKPAGEAGGGDPDAEGHSGEGSQSTGDPNSAG